MIKITPPPTTDEKRLPWSKWFLSVYNYLVYFQLPVVAKTERPAPGNQGREIFDSTSGRPIYDNGTIWVYSDGTPA